MRTDTLLFSAWVTLCKLRFVVIIYVSKAPKCIEVLFSLKLIAVHKVWECRRPALLLLAMLKWGEQKRSTLPPSWPAFSSLLSAVESYCRLGSQGWEHSCLPAHLVLGSRLFQSSIPCFSRREALKTSSGSYAGLSLLWALGLSVLLIRSWSVFLAPRWWSLWKEITGAS